MRRVIESFKQLTYLLMKKSEASLKMWLGQDRECTQCSIQLITSDYFSISFANLAKSLFLQSLPWVRFSIYFLFIFPLHRKFHVEDNRDSIKDFSSTVFMKNFIPQISIFFVCAVVFKPWALISHEQTFPTNFFLFHNFLRKHANFLFFLSYKIYEHKFLIMFKNSQD